MTRDKSLHKLEKGLKKRGRKSKAQSGLVQLQKSIPTAPGRKRKTSSGTVRIEAQSYDSGDPLVSVQYSRLGSQLSQSAGAWDIVKSSLSVESGQTPSFTVEPFAMQEDSPTENTQLQISSQIRQPPIQEKNIPRPTVVPEDMPVGPGIEPGIPSVSESSSLAQDFGAGIEPLIIQAKEQSSPATRTTTPQQNQIAAPADEEQEEQETESSPKQSYSHTVFDELGQSMQYANMFNLGSYQLSQRFDAFERELDEEEALHAADNQRALASALSAADLIEDITAIKKQSPTIKTPIPAVDIRPPQPAQLLDSNQAETTIPQSQAMAALTYAEPFGPAPGTNPGSTQADALKEAAKFAGLTNPNAAFKLSHADVSKRLVELINDPRLIEQGRLNLCGPAVFFYYLLQRDPIAFSKYVISLFKTGRGSLGGMTVSPDNDLKNQQYDSNWGSPAADWMAMSALRDDQNLLLDYEGTPEENASAATSPAEIRSWLKTTGLYSTVQNQANWMMTKSLNHAKTLKPDKKSTDVILLINAHILNKASANNKKSDEFILSAFPNHYVGLETSVTEKDGQVLFDCWTWGDFYKVSVPAETFKANYYGAVIAKK